MTPREKRIFRGLERLRARYDRRHLGSDPLAFPRRFADARDREIVGLVASSLAYGNVTAVKNSVERVLDWLGARPSELARTLSPREGLEALGGFQHRWTRARDVVALVALAGEMLERRGSVFDFFLEGYVPGDMAASLLGFSKRALTLDHRGAYRSRGFPASAGVRFFFPSPLTGACKRMNMYLRWMVRADDGLDLGIWPSVPTRDLVIPLDTHIFRIGRRLGFTERRTPGWKTAVDVTRSLSRFDPEDPVKYDFCLSRVGIIEKCPRHRRAERCELCELSRAS